MSATRVLIVHPDPSVSTLMTSMLQTLGHKIDEAPNDRVAMRVLEQAPANLVLAGADPKESDALEFLSYLRRKYPLLPVLLVFTSPHPERCREAQLRGATGVLRFPLPANTLRAAVAQALGEPEATASAKPAATNGHAASGHATNGHANTPHAIDFPARGSSYESKRVPVAICSDHESSLVGEDPAFLQVVDLATTIAPTRAAVLIVGERGVGKSLLARTMHSQSERKGAPFVEVVCSSIRETVLEVELFGRQGVAGEPDKLGKIAQTRGGTIFLDDVGALSPSLQSRLLHLLKDGEYEPVGSSTTLKADIRLILGTREDLGLLVQDGRFRQDLYYRIGSVTLKLPPLRHRGNDVERLAEHFRVQFTRRLGKSVVGFGDEAIARLCSQDWPGNIQELEQAVERAVVVCRGNRIEANHLGPTPRDVSSSAASSRLSRPPLPGSDILPLKEALEGPERQLILQALEALNWNRQETARILDINRTTLYKKMKKYGLLFDEPVWAN